MLRRTAAFPTSSENAHMEATAADIKCLSSQTVHETASGQKPVRNMRAINHRHGRFAHIRRRSQLLHYPPAQRHLSCTDICKRTEQGLCCRNLGRALATRCRENEIMRFNTLVGIKDLGFYCILCVISTIKEHRRISSLQQILQGSDSIFSV